MKTETEVRRELHLLQRQIDLMEQEQASGVYDSPEKRYMRSVLVSSKVKAATLRWCLDELV